MTSHYAIGFLLQSEADGLLCGLKLEGPHWKIFVKKCPLDSNISKPGFRLVCKMIIQKYYEFELD